MFENGAEVTRKTLIEKGIIHSRHGESVKIVGGKMAKELSFKGLGVSKGARAAIEKAGGTIA